MLREFAFVTLDVFTDRVFGGNPLAVLPSAEGLTDKAMQAIAREFNLSETAFVFPPDNGANTHKVRIFTPTAELDFAGHPTLGTAICIASAFSELSTVKEFRFEEGVGVVPVSVSQMAKNLMRAELSVAQLPVQQPDTVTSDDWAEILSLNSSDVYPGDTAPEVWSCGAPFSFVSVSTQNALAKAAVNSAAWDRYLSNSTTTGAFVFTQDTAHAEVDVCARMFAPGHGIAEDPATGSAVAALAGWLVAHGSLHDSLSNGTHQWVIEQGADMGRPSRLDLAADVVNGAITDVRVAGTAVRVANGTITVP